MSCDRIAGNNWGRARLIFDDGTEGEIDDNLDLRAPDLSGRFEGKFRHRQTGTELPDVLMEGRCNPDGSRSRISFTRKHDGVNVTTRYTGRVIPVTGSTVVMIRGRFIRATVASSGAVSITSGDYETEKPT